MITTSNLCLVISSSFYSPSALNPNSRYSNNFLFRGSNSNLSGSRLVTYLPVFLSGSPCTHSLQNDDLPTLGSESYWTRLLLSSLCSLASQLHLFANPYHMIVLIMRSMSSLNCRGSALHQHGRCLTWLGLKQTIQHIVQA